MKTKTIIIAILTALFVILVMQNSGVVSVKAYFWEVQMSGIILFPAILILGIIIGYIWAILNIKKRKGKIEETK
jgi:uncharacterized integral membrane protein